MTKYRLSNTPPSPADPRDYRYLPSTSAIAALPNRVDLRPLIPDWEDQAEQGACVLHAIPSILEFMTHGASRWEDLSRQFAYNSNLILQGRLGEEGTFPRDALETIRKIGICLESEYAYGPANAGKVPPLSAYESAITRRIGRYEAIPIMPDEWQTTTLMLKRAIYDASLKKCSPPTITMKIGMKYFELSGPLETQNYISFSSGLPGTEYAGRHEQYLCGYDDVMRGGGFFVAGSWGQQWGDNGVAFVPYTLANEFIEAHIVRSFHGVDLTDPALYARQRTVTQLYIALFGRAPEREGLQYWVAEIEGGRSVADVAQTMYGCEPARAIYPSGISNTDLIRRFYTNTLGREADAAGLAYWSAALNAGATPGSVICTIMEAVVSYAGEDPAALMSQRLFNNRVAVGMYFAVDLACNSLPQAGIALTGVTDDLASVENARKAIRSRIGLGML